MWENSYLEVSVSDTGYTQKKEKQMWYVMLCGTWLSLLNFMKWDNNIIKKDIDNM